MLNKHEEENTIIKAEQKRKITILQVVYYIYYIYPLINVNYVLNGGIVLLITLNPNDRLNAKVCVTF